MPSSVGSVKNSGNFRVSWDATALFWWPCMTLHLIKFTYSITCTSPWGLQVHFVYTSGKKWWYWVIIVPSHEGYSHGFYPCFGGLVRFKWYLQITHIYSGIFHEVNHPAVVVPPWLWKPPTDVTTVYLVGDFSMLQVLVIISSNWLIFSSDGFGSDW